MKWRPTSEGHARSGRHVLAVLVCALIVTGGMLVVANDARRDADRAREAQLLMERIRVAGMRVEALTWESLATKRTATREELQAGAAAYRDLSTSLTALHRLGRTSADIRVVEQRVSESYDSALRATRTAKADPDLARRITVTEFAPILTSLDAAVTVAADHQAEIARHALARGDWIMRGSLLGGLLLLGLLGWELHRVRRHADLTSSARDLERRSEKRLRALVRHSSDIVVVIDASARVQWIAESVQRVFGYTIADVLDRPLGDFVHPEDAHRAVRFFDHTLTRETGTEVESLRLRALSGDYRHVEIVSENRLADPLVEGVLLNLRDVTQRVALEDQLRHQAFHDTLTGLANRALFEDRLSHAITRDQRHAGTTAVLFIDLDDFKTVNDSLGHTAGDELLQAVAERTQRVLRNEDTAGRLGGDEFAILLETLSDPAEAVLIAKRIVAIFDAPFTLRGRAISVAASVGIACLEGPISPDDLLRNADVAMYAAKERGKGQVATFEPAMHERIVERLELNGDLEHALENGELSLVYQPLIDLSSDAMVGVEALLRWQHPHRGAVGPDRFIPLAEASGRIVPIGRWVLRTACEQLRDWQAARPEARGLELAVNVSTRQLEDPAFPREVSAILDETGIAPRRVTLEITERLLAENSDHMLEQLNALKAIGVQLAIDDFGTGYSALSYLRTFPVDLLKIDRSFMTGVTEDEEKMRLVRGIVDMGRALRLGIVTEGIEHAEQAELMRELRSDFGQGYLFSPPVDADAITRFLAAGTPLTPLALPG